MKTTCGPLYRRVSSLCFDKVTFATGFVAGQAEKVYLGACNAAMFRPSGTKFEQLMEIVNSVTGIYGLARFQLKTSCGTEIWVYKNPHILFHLKELEGTEENSASWHSIRGWLCGVEVLDLEFHKRDGYGEPCDV